MKIESGKLVIELNSIAAAMLELAVVVVKDTAAGKHSDEDNERRTNAWRAIARRVVALNQQLIGTASPAPVREGSN